MTTFDRKLDKALKKYRNAEERYLERFGRNSLNQVMLCDPVHPNPAEYIEASEILLDAINKNKPLEQIPKEMWDMLVF